jgi:hypothetical protein
MAENIVDDYGWSSALFMEEHGASCTKVVMMNFNYEIVGY